VHRFTAQETASLARSRRRRPARRLDAYGVLPAEQTAAAMDDASEAQALFDDLLALLEAGLVAAVDDGGAVRYTATDGAAGGDAARIRSPSDTRRSARVDDE
jgi:hypothetical protein